jgi:hypothetical protein
MKFVIGIKPFFFEDANVNVKLTTLSDLKLTT